MADRQPTPPRPVTVTEMNGRIEELERQRNQALSRCAVLSGEKAEIIDLLRHSQEEIARLTGILDGTVPPSSGEPASPALN